MFSYFSKTLVALILALSLAATPSFGQNKGDPALQSVIFFTGFGGMVGGGLGFLAWLVDPLDPNVKTHEMVLNGAALGIIAGTFIGVSVLQKQAIIPYQVPSAPSEFEGDAQHWQPTPNAYGSAGANRMHAQPILPLWSMTARF